MKRSGLPDIRPRAEIEIDDVFEAKIDRGAEILASSSKERGFRLRLLNNRLDDEIRICRVCDCAGTKVGAETRDVLWGASSSLSQAIPARAIARIPRSSCRYPHP